MKILEYIQEVIAPDMVYLRIKVNMETVRKLYVSII